MSFTCPDCNMTSHNPNDEREGYCGNCHRYTGVATLPVTDAAVDHHTPTRDLDA